MVVRLLRYFWSQPKEKGATGVEKRAGWLDMKEGSSRCYRGQGVGVEGEGEGESGAAF